MVVDRRRFLSALGLTGVGGTLFPSLLPRRAWGLDGAPKRLIVISTSHGTVYNGWKMRRGGENDGQKWEFALGGLSESQFSKSLKPLYSHRNRMLALDGLCMISAEKDIPGYRHEKGWIHAWTGGKVSFTGSDLFSTFPSIDQLVANKIARSDRLPSLELGVGPFRPISHAGKAQQLPFEVSPAQVFDRVFGLASSTDPILTAQGSVLDFARAEFAAVKPKLSSADSTKMQLHFDLVRELEQRIAGLRTAQCSSAGTLPELAATSSSYNEKVESMAHLIAAAFACDMTRVVSLSLGDVPSDDFGWGDYLSGDAHTDFAHRIFEDSRAAQAMTSYTEFHAKQVAFLVSLLESIPDSGGGSLMDNTLIVWGGELGDGWHGYDKYCCVTLGGSWYFRPGRYLHWPETTTDVSIFTGNGESITSGMPHQHLLTSVGNAMGLSVDHVGDKEVANKQGRRTSLTGPLAGMR